VADSAPEKQASSANSYTDYWRKIPQNVAEDSTKVGGVACYSSMS